MDLYYIKDEEKIGPCTQEELGKAESEGELTPETLVWYEGLEDWQPWVAIKSTFAPTSSQNTDDGVTCVVCAQAFAPEAVVEFGGDVVCAGCKNTYIQRIKEGVDDAGPTGLGMWRKKKTLIVTPHADFPDRCVKCNEPANGFRKKLQLIYHPPYVIFLFLFIGILALLLGKKHKVEVGLCHGCRKKRTTGILLGVTAVFLFFGGCVGGIGVSNNSPTVGGLMIFGGIILGLIAAIVAAIKTSLIRAQHISPEYVKISGAGPKFLDSLPEFDR